MRDYQTYGIIGLEFTHFETEIVIINIKGKEK